MVAHAGCGFGNFSMLTSHDVVRHRLVTDIVDAYGRWDATQDRHDDVRRGASGPSKRGRR
jgi:phosphate starvation-inducible PhoH-like protein